VRTSAIDASPPPFEEHYQGVLLDLRGALTELLLSVEADPTNPQELARRFGLNRNLTWKVSRLIRASDLFGVFPQMPGASAMTIFLKALRRAGAPKESLQAVQRAMEEFESMVKIHAGDRANLELMLDSLSPEGMGTEPLEISRKLAFRGNSGIWGTQARLRLRAFFIAPNADDPDMLDTAQITGLVDLRRLRPGAVQPFFRMSRYNDDGSQLDAPRQLSIEPDVAGYEGSMLMPSFCSSPLPPLRVVEHGAGLSHVLGEGPLGNRGASSIIYGSLTRRFAQRHRDESNIYGECLTDINVPAESLLFDLIVHRDVVDDLQPEVKLFQGAATPLLKPLATQLPCPEGIQDIGAGPPRMATPLMPRYGKLIDSVFERAGWDPLEFRAVRFEMKYPPVNSSVLVRYSLPEKRS
jgi:transposase-like protein